MEENTSLKDEIRALREDLASKKKTRFLKIPRKARISKAKLKKGFITIAVIHENKNVEFIKEPIVDSTVKVKDTFHALDSDDVFFYKGRPLIFQPKSKINPYNPLKGEHETYGQKYLMARMEGDKIITKRSIGWGMTIGGLILGAVILYAILSG